MDRQGNVVSLNARGEKLGELLERYLGSKLTGGGRYLSELTPRPLAGG